MAGRDVDVDFEVVIPTNKTSLAPVLSGLVPHAPFPLRLVMEHAPRDPETLTLLDTLSHMGCKVSLDVHGTSGAGHARYRASLSEHDSVVVMDDDVVLSTQGGFNALAEACRGRGFACPIVRFAQNFTTQTAPSHREIWEEVSRSHPSVQRALSANGPGFIRVYDTGKTESTNQLSGPCYAAETEKLEEASRELIDWVCRGEDVRLGDVLGTGVAVGGIHAYHFGWFTETKWGGENLVWFLAQNDPMLFRQLVDRFGTMPKLEDGTA